MLMQLTLSVTLQTIFQEITLLHFSDNYHLFFMVQ